MRTRIVIQNLKCGGCAKTITTRLAKEADVLHTEVLVDESAVVVKHDNTNTPIRIKEVLKQLGYPSVEEANGMLLKARSVMSCAAGKIKE